jgi:sugar phosphate isomerase/epimerase
MKDPGNLCIHTITTKPLGFAEACRYYSERGIRGISIWRDAIKDIPPAEVKALLSEYGLQPVSYCRGGFFPDPDPTGRKVAIEDNLRMIDEASTLGAPLIVLVCGSHPGQSLETSRAQIREGIEIILPEAKKAGIRLAIEPLHPMYADKRSAINTMKQANELAEAIGSTHVGVAVDVYHVWWDPSLKEEIHRCGKNRHLFAFHICDWLTPTRHMLNDRGLMGEGCINIPQIRGWVEETGFEGYHEVEIFSDRWWAEDQEKFLDRIVKAYEEYC